MNKPCNSPNRKLQLVEWLANGLHIGASVPCFKLIYNLYNYRIYMKNPRSLLQRSAVSTLVERIILIRFSTIVADKTTNRITWYVKYSGVCVTDTSSEKMRYNRELQSGREIRKHLDRLWVIECCSQLGNECNSHFGDGDDRADNSLLLLLLLFNVQGNCR